jgi:peptide subunit release factor 1 (eRF1)
MDKHKRKELREFIDKAHDKLVESEMFNQKTFIHESLHEILNALRLIRSELKDDK